MKKYLVIFLIASLAAAPSFAQLTPASQALGGCMVDSLTGKERKKMATWIFFAMSAHPEIQQFSKVDQGTRDGIDQYIAGLITRLMTENCPDETKAALQESSLAIQNAFQLVGQVAMQELMASQEVNIAISNFEKYLDQNDFSSLSE